jgi:hypothetical protein
MLKISINIVILIIIFIWKLSTTGLLISSFLQPDARLLKEWW